MVSQQPGIRLIEESNGVIKGFAFDATSFPLVFAQFSPSKGARFLLEAPKVHPTPPQGSPALPTYHTALGSIYPDARESEQLGVEAGPLIDALRAFDSGKLAALENNPVHVRTIQHSAQAQKRFLDAPHALPKVPKKQRRDDPANPAS